ncbi:hypothetical protein BT69DRAFT_1303748 [Atractiella rhizophila]|nr:hypothetical protein BT69DRAFT_1303748 [Atractiella rhizophila]
MNKSVWTIEVEKTNIKRKSVANQPHSTALANSRLAGLGAGLGGLGREQELATVDGSFRLDLPTDRKPVVEMDWSTKYRYRTSLGDTTFLMQLISSPPKIEAAGEGQCLGIAFSVLPGQDFAIEEDSWRWVSIDIALLIEMVLYFERDCRAVFKNPPIQSSKLFQRVTAFDRGYCLFKRHKASEGVLLQPRRFWVLRCLFDICVRFVDQYLLNDSELSVVAFRANHPKKPKHESGPSSIELPAKRKWSEEDEGNKRPALDLASANFDFEAQSTGGDEIASAQALEC